MALCELVILDLVKHASSVNNFFSDLERNDKKQDASPDQQTSVYALFENGTGVVVVHSRHHEQYF